MDPVDFDSQNTGNKWTFFAVSRLHVPQSYHFFYAGFGALAERMAIRVYEFGER